MRSFAKQYAHRFPDHPISGSQVSRWESGTSWPTTDILTRYETVLALSPGLLTSIADAATRYHSPHLGTPQLQRDLPDADQLHNRMDDLLDGLLGSDATRGRDWDELTCVLSTDQDLYLHRTQWIGLTERLISEVLVAEGVPYFQRFEAMARLMSHPRGQQAAIAACTALARDHDNQVFTEPLSLLDGTQHPAANEHLKAQLADPTNDHALRGALLATVRKIRFNHFSGPDTDILLKLVLNHADDRAATLSIQSLTSELLRLLVGRSSKTLGAVHLHALREDAELLQILQTGSIAHSAEAATRVQRITAAVFGRLRDGPADETIQRGFRVLIDEVLHSPVSDVRMLAAQTVAASPLRHPLADALVRELSDRDTFASRTMTRSILQAMRFVGRPAHRRLLEQLALHGPLPSERATGAVWSYSHAAGTARPDFWGPAFVAHSEAWRRTRSPLAEESLHGLVYALGVHGANDVLTTVANDRRLPAEVRSATRWWQALPTTIRASATQ